MKSILRTALFYCLLTPLFAQTSLSVSMDKEYYAQPTNFNSASGFSVSAQHFFDSLGELGAKFSSNSTSMIIQSPSRNNSAEVNATDFYLLYRFTFIQPIFSIAFKPVVGIGVKSISRDSYIIDLGALGFQKNPATRENYFSSFFSLIASKNITSRLGIFIEPGLVLYDTNSFIKIFSLRGGVQLAIE